MSRELPRPLPRQGADPRDLPGRFRGAGEGVAQVRLRLRRLPPAPRTSPDPRGVHGCHEDRPTRIQVDPRAYTRAVPLRSQPVWLDAKLHEVQVQDARGVLGCLQAESWRSQVCA